MMVQLRSVLTIPSDVTAENCWGMPLVRVRDDRLKAGLTAVCNKWLGNCSKQGYDYHVPDDVHVYGPFPGSSRLSPIADAEVLLELQDWNELAVEKDPSPHAFSMYMLVANFIQRVVPRRGTALVRS